MSNLMTGGQMRAHEQAVIGGGSVTGLALMQRAGQGVFDAISQAFAELSDACGRRALILCGPGNNGGDGFVVAHLLAAAGWAVDVALLGEARHLPPDAAANHAIWVGTGAKRRDVLSLDQVVPLIATQPAPDLVVDALLGTGLRRGLSEGVAEALRVSIEAARHSVAVDILSGLCADSGKWLGQAADLTVDLTVTFHTAKPGHYLAAGGRATRRLVIVDIGLPVQSARIEDAELIDAPAYSGEVARKDPASHKYGSGHALVLSGGPGRTGAARLAARAALRIGAGLVTIAVPPGAQQEVACQITAIMLTRVTDAEALGVVLEDKRYSALCLGPGLGVGERTRSLVSEALSAGRSVVLDADGLTSFADDPMSLFEQVRGADVVLTPHGGEFARLFPDLAEQLRAVAETGPAVSKIDVVRAAAARAGCTVLLKGADTVIAAPDGRVRVHAACRERAAPWLATAGAGDVLAGFVTGLMARGLEPLEAASHATWLHVGCARAFGPGLIAEDLPEALPGVLKALL